MTTTDLNDQVDSLDFAVEKSMRYHQRRRGFYDSRHKVIMFFVVLSGSAAFSGLSEYFAAIAAALAAVDLVWGPSHLARDHEMLFRRFSALAIEIRTSTPSAEAHNRWIKERVTIETDELPVYRALEADCDNEVRRAWGRDRELVHIGSWYRLTMNILRHAEAQF